LENVLLVAQLHQIESISCTLALGCLEEATGKTPDVGTFPKKQKKSGLGQVGSIPKIRGLLQQGAVLGQLHATRLIEAGQLLRLQPTNQFKWFLCKIM
jgi:hypothetical protein